MGSGVGHATTAARWTKAATLAREGDQPFELAIVAAQAEEPVSQDAAAQECPQLLLGKVRNRSFTVAREEVGELLFHGSVEQSFFGLAPNVLARCAALGRKRCGHAMSELRKACRASRRTADSQRGVEPRGDRRAAIGSRVGGCQCQKGSGIEEARAPNISAIAGSSRVPLASTNTSLGRQTPCRWGRLSRTRLCGEIPDLDRGEYRESLPNRPRPARPTRSF